MPLRLEALEQRALLASDFGDAPTPYPTLLAEDGARHNSVGARLGASRDSEANGTHSANANADGADENGVTLGQLRTGALDATLTANVQGGSGRLDAWIDFNGDGNWGGPGEQILAGVNVAAGNTVLAFDVPSWANSGTTFARFRLSTAGNLGPTGAAFDGELEDYAVTIRPAAAGSGAFGGQNTISSFASGGTSVVGADVDGDGDMDVLSAARLSSTITWHENDGTETFVEHIISGNASGANSVFATDLDGDGDLDVLSASQGNGTIAWYENDGDQNFTDRTVSTNASGGWAVTAADVDGDGDQDVLSASSYDSKIAWYENNGNQNFTARTISTNAARASSVFTADVDSDGDLDVLSASRNDDKIAWYENDGNQSFTTRVISSTALFAESVFAIDIDGDGDIDVVSGSATDNKIAWYENDGNQVFTEREISTDTGGPRAVIAADIDGDGDVDVLSASQGGQASQAAQIAVHENNGNQVFTTRAISTAGQPISVYAADVDGDGDLDALSASYTGDIAWFEQNGQPALTRSIGASVVEGNTVVIGRSRLLVSDDNSAAELVYGVINQPIRSQLELTTAPGVAIGSFTQADINLNRLVYRHNGSESASDSFQFTVSDGEGGVLPSGSFNLTVTRLNDAPRLNASLNPALPTIAEDQFNTTGALVSSLLTGAVTDPGAGALRGIAIIAAPNTNGTWQYSLNGGTSWVSLAATSSSSARLLPDTVGARVRFVPKPDFNGIAAFSYRAWDRTQGTVGGLFNVTGVGGSTAFSIATENARIVVSPVNDAPVLGGIGGSIGYARNTAAIALAPSATVADVDNFNFNAGQLRVRITGVAEASNRLAIGGSFTVNGSNQVFLGATQIGTRTLNGAGTNDLVVSLNANATKAVVAQLVRAIRFRTVGGGAGVRNVLFSLSDGAGATSLESTKTVNVT